jgi:hypothetical protein
MVALTTTTLATIALAAPTGAATSGLVTVTGGSVATLELTLDDPTAAFGASLSPDGLGASGESDGVNIGTAGACFEWAGTATVRSNVAYNVSEVAAAANGFLDFLSSDPTTYAQCTAGQPFSTTSSTWVSGASRSASQAHGYRLSLDVQWDATPSATLGSASLTVSVTAAP